MPIRKLNEKTPSITAQLVINDVQFVESWNHSDVLVLQYDDDKISDVALTITVPAGLTVADPDDKNGHKWVGPNGGGGNQWRLEAPIPASGRQVIAYHYDDPTKPAGAVGNTSGASVIIIERPPS